MYMQLYINIAVSLSLFHKDNLTSSLTSLSDQSYVGCDTIYLHCFSTNARQVIVSWRSHSRYLTAVATNMNDRSTVMLSSFDCGVVKRLAALFSQVGRWVHCVQVKSFSETDMTGHDHLMNFVPMPILGYPGGGTSKIRNALGLSYCPLGDYCRYTKTNIWDH